MGHGFLLRNKELGIFLFSMCVIDSEGVSANRYCCQAEFVVQCSCNAHNFQSYVHDQKAHTSDVTLP